MEIESLAMSATLTTVYENTWPPRGQVSSGAKAMPGPIREGSLIVTPIMAHDDSVFGAEVSGVDWSRPISQEMANQVILPRHTLTLRMDSPDCGSSSFLSKTNSRSWCFVKPDLITLDI
jgi:hypothetical protein